MEGMSYPESMPYGLGANNMLPPPSSLSAISSLPNMTLPSMPTPTMSMGMSTEAMYGMWGTSPAIARAVAATQQPKRPRSEKKTIPEQQKDGKYFERRKRNNMAAKKSRDARKAREDEIAIRASFLEKENAILKAQVNTLREEATSLRQLLVQKRRP